MRNKVLKLTKRKISYIIRNKNSKSNKQLAQELRVSISTVNRVWMYWLKHGKPLELKPFGRPRKEVSKEDEELVLKTFQKYKVGARRLEEVIEAEHAKHVPHNRIHAIMLKHRLAKPNPRKQKRRKYIRFERHHSLTTVQMDWHESKVNGKQVCVALDDASRKILAGGEFDSATEENSIQLVQEVISRYGYLKLPDQVLTDHGPQFTASRRDSDGNAEHAFEQLLRENSIQHIKASVKHPQTCGKVEKWFDAYERFRGEFNSFEEFVEWYNCVRYHESLDTKHFLLTPEQAFWYKMQPGCLLKMFLDGDWNGKDL